MIASLRAFGYDFAMAIADLIDNSIYANARNISVDYSWNDGAPWFRIVDDGSGMTEAVLKTAMRVGSKNPLEKRDKRDLGRFGLGLKTAAFSQGKVLSVRTKTKPKNPVYRCWDLDHVQRVNKWELLVEPKEDAKEILSILDDFQSGTVVLCQRLDRITKDEEDPDAEANFLEKFTYVAKYLEMVFHRYLKGRPRVKIRVGRHECQGWDPFIATNAFTQERSTEHLDHKQISVTPFVLPHVSNRNSEENTLGAGIQGWNAHQGFYVYRNKRMIISGGYLDFDLKPEEHYKLCRIRIDLPNSVDHEWNIDVRKAAASPPSHVRADLERIARSTRTEAAEVYRARVGRPRKAGHKPSKHEVWVKVRKGDKVLYKINRDNEAIDRLLRKSKVTPAVTRQLFHLIERAVPHRAIVLDNAEREDCLVDLPPEIEPPPPALLKLCEDIFRSTLKRIHSPNAAARIACLNFDPHVSYRAHLDRIIEEMNGRE